MVADRVLLPLSSTLKGAPKWRNMPDPAET